jgi:hypothetical protein
MRIFSINVFWTSFWRHSERDKVVLSKTVLSNFCPKQVNEWIGGPRASLFQLFIAFLTWPNLTCLNRPLSQFFHHQTPLGWPLIWQFFLNFEKWTWKGGGGGQIIEHFLACLTRPNLTCWRIPLILSFIT